MKRKARRVLTALALLVVTGGVALWLLWPTLEGEVFYFTEHMNLRHAMESLWDVHGESEPLGNPFAPDHRLSQIKPDMTVRPLPLATPPETQTVAVGAAEFSFPLTGRLKLHKKTPTLGASILADERNVHISQWLFHDAPFREMRDLLAQHADKAYFPEVDAALRGIDQLPAFERLVRSTQADASGLKWSHPLGTRFATLALLVLKFLCMPAHEHVPWRYYKGGDLQCFVTGPETYRSEGRQVSGDFDPEDPEQLQALMSQAETAPVVSVTEEERFFVWLSDAQGRTVVELRFTYPIGSDAELITRSTLEFIGQCSFEYHPEAQAPTDPNSGAHLGGRQE